MCVVPWICWTRGTAAGRLGERLGERLGSCLLEDVRTTMIYLHVMNKPGLAVKSPADTLE